MNEQTNTNSRTRAFANTTLRPRPCRELNMNKHKQTDRELFTSSRTHAHSQGPAHACRRRVGHDALVVRHGFDLEAWLRGVDGRRRLPLVLLHGGVGVGRRRPLGLLGCCRRGRPLRGVHHDGGLERVLRQVVVILAHELSMNCINFRFMRRSVSISRWRSARSELPVRRRPDGLYGLQLVSGRGWPGRPGLMVRCLLPRQALASHRASGQSWAWAAGAHVRVQTACSCIVFGSWISELNMN